MWISSEPVFKVIVLQRPQNLLNLGGYKQWIRGAGPVGTWDPWGPLLFSCNVIACN